MNYLAHAYLSFGHPGVLTGNLISDFVKGRRKFDYPVEVQQGIELHRAIDRFTDAHEATRAARELFRPVYRLYGGAFVDVVYDHFLACDETIFSEESLFRFAQDTYSTLDRQAGWMPERFARFFPFMKQQNWLFHYRTRWGTHKSMGGLVKRAAYMDDAGPAFGIFETHYQRLSDHYRHFWADVRPFAEEQFRRLQDM
ncbi:MAG: hypothetical protein RJA57_1813 [Bacteroidota bacterium]|jgi:acyl carrier protein phosphodiesterase